MATFNRLAIALAVPFLLPSALAADLATITPCPDCPSAIAPSPITVHSQYQTVSVCKPSTTTVLTTNTALNQTRIGSAISTVPSCTPSVFVSTTIPVHSNGHRKSTLVTATEQPVTFNYLHSVETRAVVARAESTTTTTTTSTIGTTTTTLTLSTTIAVKSYCDYASIGPLAIPGYEGSGLCKDCGPDANGVLTQRFTVVSCANHKCTTFNETWLASPKTHQVDGKHYIATTTETYCPTATPETQMPGYTPPAAPAAYATGHAAASPAAPAYNAGAAPTPYAGHPADTPASYGQPSSPEAYPHQAGGSPASYGAPEYSHPAGPASYGAPEYSHPASYAAPPSYSHPSAPAYSHPSAPAYSHPSAPSYSHPSAPAYGTTLHTYATPTHYASQSTTCTTDTDVYGTPEPTSYDGGEDGGADPSADPSGAMGYDPPQPTTYSGRTGSYKVFKRQGLERPRGSVMRRSGLLFWGV